jgi:hypothetical protein
LAPIALIDIDRMTGLSGLILLTDAAIGKPKPSSRGLLGTKVGDGSAFSARNGDSLLRSLEGIDTLVFALARRFGDWLSYIWNPRRGP